MNILLIDAYDSFVHTIHQYLLTLGAQVDIVRSDQYTIAEVQDKNYDLIVLGPGPGHPKDVGYVELINAVKNTTPIFGVCLGMQAMVLAFGGKILQAKHLMHGKTCEVDHDGNGCFEGLPNPLTVTRYHSLIGDPESLKDGELLITATSTDDGYIMGLRHKHLPIEGVQFHPESIGTTDGMKLLENVLKLY